MHPYFLLLSEILVDLNNKNPESDIRGNAERSERLRNKPQPPLTLPTAQPERTELLLPYIPLSVQPYHSVVY